MARQNPASMNVQELLNLRKQVEATLAQRRTELEKQLKDLGSFDDGVRVGRRRGGSALKGIKVAPKYRLGNQTWAGRGQKPKWLVAAMKDGGKKLDDFLIEKAARKRKS
jgi:DNA-binding protein H-NS